MHKDEKGLLAIVALAQNKRLRGRMVSAAVDEPVKKGVLSLLIPFERISFSNIPSESCVFEWPLAALMLQ